MSGCAGVPREYRYVGMNWLRKTQPGCVIGWAGWCWDGMKKQRKGWQDFWMFSKDARCAT